MRTTRCRRGCRTRGRRLITRFWIVTWCWITLKRVKGFCCHPNTGCWRGRCWHYVLFCISICCGCSGRFIRITRGRSRFPTTSRQECPPYPCWLPIRWCMRRYSGIWTRLKVCWRIVTPWSRGDRWLHWRTIRMFTCVIGSCGWITMRCWRWRLGCICMRESRRKLWRQLVSC